MENILQTANIVTPVFIIVLIGYFLKRKSLFSPEYNRISSKIVFTVTMPALVFQKIATTNYREVFDLKLILFIYSAILIIFLFVWLVSHYICKNGQDQGAFIQASFRSNYAIIGFALISNAFGPQALAKAAIVLAFIMPVYNILAVIALTVPMRKEKAANVKRIIKEIITNPLILAAIIAMPFSYYGFTILPVLETTINYLAALTLPLALLSIGGSLSLYDIKKEFNLTLVATMIKIILVPLVFTILAVKTGFRGQDLVIMFFLFGCPTAVASYIMAEAMGSNSKLAGNIILTTTLGSIVTLSLGIFLLKSMHYF